jgi:hypothetical protein
VPTLQSGGTACYAFIVKNGEINLEYGLDSTNNVDEYTGIIKALEWLLENNCENENIIIRLIACHQSKFGHTKRLLEGGLMAIHPQRFDKLITSLRTVVENNGKLQVMTGCLCVCTSLSHEL